MKIATGLLLKQNLFEGVLNSGSLTDEVDFSEKGKSQFIKQLEEVLDGDDFSPSIKDDIIIENEEDEDLLEMVTEVNSKPNITSTSQKPISEEKPIIKDNIAKKETDFEQMEEVMTKGMEFLTGIYKMSTGNDMNGSGKPKVNIDKETGEVSITFKMDF